MKVKIKEVKGFVPIELKITIQSEEELLDLVKRCNINEKDLNIYETYYKSSKSSLYDLWEVLEKLYQDLK